MKLTRTFSLWMLLGAVLAAQGEASSPRRIAADRLGTERITGVYRNASQNLEIFNRDGGGFVVASDNKVVGYSDTDTFDPASAPAALLELLEAYREDDAEHPAKAPQTSASIAPLLGSIAWDQTEPYNLLCPAYLGSSRSATGCAATAMAQIMRYHRYPARGQGSHSYQPKQFPKMGTISADFSRSVYDWDNMLESYAGASTEAQQNAVARLMFDAGVAISMDYGIQSGALSQDWPNAIVEYFAYDPGVALRFRANYEIDDWNGVIRSELEAGRPVYATGFTSEGGHAFVFDGIDASGLVHVNWGWSGMSNGYFDTTFLTPSSQGTGGSNGGFNSRQMIVTGICPPFEGSEPFVALASEEGLSAPAKVTPDQSFTVRLNGKISNVGWRNSTVDFGLALTDGSGATLRTYPGAEGIEVKPGTPHRNLTFDNVTLGELPSGGYRLVPEARNAGGSVWERVRDIDTAYPNYLNVTVDGSTVSISSPEAASLESSGLKVDGCLYSGLKGRITASVANRGESEYYGSLTPVLLDPATRKRVAAATGSVADIMPGSSAEVELLATFDVYPGEYLLSIIDNNYSLIAEPLAVTLGANPGLVIEAVSAPDFGDNDAVDPLDVRAEAEVGCGAGLFSGHLFLYFLIPGGDTVMGCIGPEFLQLSDGATGKVTFTGLFENGQPGEEYDACIVNAEEFTYVKPREKATTRFRVKGSSALDIPVAGPASSPRYFNIQGVELGSRPVSGLYIEVCGSRAVKRSAK